MKKKYLKESETNVSWQAYDVKAKRKVEIQNPKAVKMKNASGQSRVRPQSRASKFSGLLETKSQPSQLKKLQTVRKRRKNQPPQLKNPKAVRKQSQKYFHDITGLPKLRVRK